MEDSAPSDSSAPQDISSESPTDPPDSDSCSTRHIPVSEFQSCLSGSLVIKDVEISTRDVTTSLEKNGIGNAAKKDGQEDHNETDSSYLAAEKCYSKCATFPRLGDHKSTVKGGPYNSEGKRGDSRTAKSVDQSYSRSVTLPTPMKLVSALKGSREKLGSPREKLSVSWAPDVYDPTPMAASHVPSNKSQSYQSESKKSGKNKQKAGGKSSQGKRGKGKKQNLKKSTSHIHYAEVVF